MKIIALIAVSVFAACASLGAQVARYVDPFLGSDGGGNVFPGATVPFGMVKAGPDMGDNTGNAGWLPKGNINGFSQTHVSGTGGGAKYGNILVQPTTGEVNPSDLASPGSSEQASAGLYRVRLNRYGTDVEVTATRRVALYRFTYGHAGQANIVIDAGHCLSSYPNQNEDQRIVASSVRVVSDTEIDGFSSVTGGWNQQPNTYTVYFYALSDTPAERLGSWRDGRIDFNANPGSEVSGVRTGAWLQFKPHADRVARLKIGISLVSEEQARQNALGEIDDFDFDTTRNKAVTAWNEALGKLEIGGVSEEEKQKLYTALYHTMLMPVDRTGENNLWQSPEPYYDDFYAIWDTFRTSGPLLTLVAPKRQAAMVRALVDIYRHEGWLPDARSGNYNGRTQGGSNAEFLIADAYLKKLPGIDWNDAYTAMTKDAEVDPKNQVKEGRGAVDVWKRFGYVSIEDVDRPGSKQMEYAADDFEIAVVAKGLGKVADHEKYFSRSENWEKLWNPDLADAGFKGFIWPRHKDGTWKGDFNGTQGCTWGGDTFYEGNSWTYSLFVPHNVARLIEKSGGAEEFVKRLDAFFEGPGRYDVGNEPGFLAPYLYLWAGRHDKTAEHLRAIIAANFHSGRGGLPGNDDSGAMSSWYLFGAMGIFPNAGQDVYLIGSPTIAETKLHVGSGNTFTIEARNVSAENKYVIAAELNGKPYNKAWFRHEEIERGGRLVLTMSAKPGAWPDGEAPPSAHP